MHLVDVLITKYFVSNSMNRIVKTGDGSEKVQIVEINESRKNI